MKHLSQETLVMLVDSELSARQADAAHAHLALCADCCRRRDHLAAVMQTASEESLAKPDAAPNAAVRRALAHRLIEASSPQTRSWFAPRLVMQAAGVLLVVLSAFAFRSLYRPLQDSMAAYEETGPKPNHAVTPGAVRAVELSELCAMPDDDLDPTVAPEKQRTVFATYGLNAAQAKGYQVDYLINPQLGGNDDLENLWPEPYHATVWNASAKDALEARLHGMVCSGSMSLDEAQQELSTDWIATYKKVFHADRPVRVQAVVDR